jgi:hypothetical protein
MEEVFKVCGFASPSISNEYNYLINWGTPAFISIDTAA